MKKSEPFFRKKFNKIKNFFVNFNIRLIKIRDII